MAEMLSVNEQLLHRTCAVYREFHQNPELSMNEHETAARIEGHLDALKIRHFRCANTGVVGIAQNGPGPTIAFRADIDGLPILEKTGLEYASVSMATSEEGVEVPVMHACGHDVHMACLLGAMSFLHSNPDSWRGTLVGIFQPGEETGTGAQAMLDDGLWEQAPRPEVIFAQHVVPQLYGTISYSTGDATSLADSWRVTLKGRGSHGSKPHASIDPILLGAHIITRIQGIVSRETDPSMPVVITVGTFHAGHKENIIPETAELTLNIRTVNQDSRERVTTAVRRVILSEAMASNAPEPLIEKISSFPRNYNDPNATNKLIPTLIETFGQKNVLETPPVMASEDFGLLAESIGVPSVYWRFGGFNQSMFLRDPVPANHSSEFAPDMENSIRTGTQAALSAILSRLGTK